MKINNLYPHPDGGIRKGSEALPTRKTNLPKDKQQKESNDQTAQFPDIPYDTSSNC